MSFKIEHIAFSYENRPVLRDISLEIETGFFYGILGPNGCGKSTFIDLLMGYLKPDAGTITYRNRPLAAWPRKELACEIALVPQNFYINFPFTGSEVIIMGRYPHIPRFSTPSPDDLNLVETIMEKTGTAKFRDRHITEMSGGERQRVIFARALAQDTPVLMLDEATSSLDVNHTFAFFDIVLADVRQRGKTAVAVIQDINLAATYCDRLVLMKDGYVAASGDTDKVLTEANIRTVFGVESRVFRDDFSGSSRVSFRRGI